MRLSASVPPGPSGWLRPLTLLAALLLAALPTLALDPPPLPTARASVSGTVSSLSGSTVRIVNDLVSFDASTARILTRTGPATLAAVTVGSRVFAGVQEGSTGLVASTVVVEDLPEGTLSGVVDAVDTAGLTLTVEGLLVKVTNATTFGGNGGGTRVDGLEDIRVGQLVEVVLSSAGGSLSAVRVHVLAPVPLPSVHLRGTVRVIGATSWVITTREPAGNRDVTVGVTAETRIVGEPAVGDPVEVLGTVDTSGQITATLIARIPATEPPQVITFDGQVRSIHGPVWTVGGQRVHVTPMTTITGSPVVGDTVTVTGYRTPAGVMATSIVKK